MFHSIFHSFFFLLYWYYFAAPACNFSSLREPAWVRPGLIALQGISAEAVSRCSLRCSCCWNAWQPVAGQPWIQYWVAIVWMAKISTLPIKGSCTQIGCSGIDVFTKVWTCSSGRSACHLSFSSLPFGSHWNTSWCLTKSMNFWLLTQLLVNAFRCICPFWIDNWLAK